MKIKGLIMALLTMMVGIAVDAQITLVKDNKPQARIVLADTTWQNRQAADVFNTFMHHMSGITLPVTVGGKANRGTVLIGGMTTAAGEDGFLIDCEKGKLIIRSGGDKGAILGVVHLLERYLGCDYYALDAWEAPRRATVTLPRIDHWTETPAFRYRQTNTYSQDDPYYNLWYGFEVPSQMFMSDMWVHTFNRILPALRYGKEHPEWYSLIEGTRRTGDHSQWCLSNPEVLEAACVQLDSIFRANPGMTMISVSQNDGNGTQCQCDNCKAIYEEEGAVSGAYIRFMNKLAERFPDKEFSTLAYLFTMQPPRHVKPLPNVNIMLCDIDCMREVPLTDNATGRSFVSALEGWSSITNNIFVWDYGINFDNLVSPFPNFHVLQPNIQLFKKNHTNMLFEQMNGGLGVDFSELRAYMVGKLMWNPNLDADSLMRHFLNGYYGAAGPYLYQYRKIMEAELLKSGVQLWIYDSPITHKNGMLSMANQQRYDALFDQAEAAVADDTVLLRRVHIGRLPLQYAELEIARTQVDNDVEKLKVQVALFRNRCARYAIPSLNERNNKPLDYCDMYLKRYIPQETANVALGATVSYDILPQERYQPIAGTALTDGLYGGTTFVEGWVGWYGTDAEFTLDMGKECQLTHIETDFLHQLGAWILLPRSVSYSVSTDGHTFQPFGNAVEFAEDRDPAVKFVPGAVDVPQPVEARYIHVTIRSIGNCPDWHYGVGYPAWFFCDEVTAW